MNTPNVEQICKLLKIGKATYYRYKKSDEPILKLINYFSKEELEELIVNGKIGRLERKGEINKEYTLKIDNLNELIIDHTIYQLRDRLRLITEQNFINWLGHIGVKKILIKVLKELNTNNLEYSMSVSKKFLLEQIEKEEISLLFKGNKKQLITFIEDGFSNLDCYVLINHYDKVMNYQIKE